jgi:predicted O-methyltransferase YrrM
MYVSRLNSAYNHYKQQAGSYGTFFEGLTKILNPQLIVEIGVCEGYSAVHFAKGLKECGCGGKLECYDLWEDEESKSNIAIEERNTHLVPTMDKFLRLVSENKLDEFVNVHTKEAFIVLPYYDDEEIDIIHLDISNCGKVIEDIMPEVHRTLKSGGYFLHEGGAGWRDDIGWMKKFNKRSIVEERNNNFWLGKYFEVFVIDQYPSLTVCKKK